MSKDALTAATGIDPAFLVLGGTAGLVYQALGEATVRGAEYGLAERDPGGRRGPGPGLADVAESVGAADLDREQTARHQQAREDWLARLREYQGRRASTCLGEGRLVAARRTGRYNELCRWPVITSGADRSRPRRGQARKERDRVAGSR
jgi:hypothetical protein